MNFASDKVWEVHSKIALYAQDGQGHRESQQCSCLQTNTPLFKASAGTWHTRPG